MSLRRLDLAARTPGEDLWLRRRAAGLTRIEAAKRLGIGLTLYSQLENGHKTRLGPGFGPFGPDRTGLLRLARRRAAHGLRGTADRVGVSVPTLLKMERRGDARLAGFWAARGFTNVHK